VLPSATHTRFADCIGALDTARTLVQIAEREIGERADPNRSRRDRRALAGSWPWPVQSSMTCRYGPRVTPTRDALSSGERSCEG
jgi:hypothetical protein